MHNIKRTKNEHVYFSGLSRAHNAFTIFTAVLKTRYEGELVAQVLRCFRATLNISGKHLALFWIPTREGGLRLSE